VRAMPTNPVTFTLRYYARYPVISPATYPPLFYLLEGAAFQVFGASALTARALVAAFAVVVGVYTMAWGRRWIGPAAGWCGAFVVFTPALVIWTNAVMLNVPATALGIACLYHLRRWLDGATPRHAALAVVFLASLLLTYYPGVLIVPLCIAWLALAYRPSQVRRGRSVWVAILAAAAVVPLALAAYLAPVQLARHLPSLRALLRVSTWTFYWSALPAIVGIVLLIVGTAGLVLAWRVPRLRVEAVFIASWVLALILCATPLPAKDTRYILLIAPAFVLAAALGVAALFEGRLPLRPVWQGALVGTGLLLAFWSARSVDVPQVSGFREIAEYIHAQGPSDTVLYDGHYDGVFGFYARALDPGFNGRLVRGGKLLYEAGPTTTFQPRVISRVHTIDDVIDILGHECGCRWVAAEVGPLASRPPQQTIRAALTRSEFSLVRSFPVQADGIERVDLYRVAGPVNQVTTVDLKFPAFTTRVFGGVVPIAR
jgi:hypothetical protein